MSKHTGGAVFPAPRCEIGPCHLGNGGWKARRSVDFAEQATRGWKRALSEEQAERGVAQIRVRSSKVPRVAGRRLPGTGAGSHDAATADVCATPAEFLAQSQPMQAQDEREYGCDSVTE